MTLTDKQKAINYYLIDCQKRGIPRDLWDVEAELDESLSLSELMDIVDNHLNNLDSPADVSNAEARAQLEEHLALITKQESQAQSNFKQNWECLSNARSIYVFGGVRTGKTAFVHGICKQLEQFKQVFWYKFPNKQLLSKEGWHYLGNLNELSKLTDAVVVLEEYVLTMPHDKRNNDELEKILVLAGQNNLTIIIISQVSQVVNKRLESLIDCYVCMDCDYTQLKNGSRLKNMIKDASTFSPEHFKLERGHFLYYSRNFPVFDKTATFDVHPQFNSAWSLAYKNLATTKTNTVMQLINKITWSVQK